MFCLLSKGISHLFSVRKRFQPYPNRGFAQAIGELGPASGMKLKSVFSQEVAAAAASACWKNHTEFICFSIGIQT